jgi:hypothetical protein
VLGEAFYGARPAKTREISNEQAFDAIAWCRAAKMHDRRARAPLSRGGRGAADTLAPKRP